jgi:hypothetical protein
MLKPACLTGLTLLLLGYSPDLEAQAAPPLFPSWNAEQVPASTRNRPSIPDSLRSRRHTGTGLLIGGLAGAAATTIFLIGFCDDPDTQCGVDEVGRATLFIAVPSAALGALIGYLIRTED